MYYLRKFQNIDDYNEFIESGDPSCNLFVCGYEGSSSVTFSDICNDKSNPELYDVAVEHDWLSEERPNVLTIRDVNKVDDEKFTMVEKFGDYVQVGEKISPVEKIDENTYIMNGNVYSAGTYYTFYGEIMIDTNVDEEIIIESDNFSAITPGTYTLRKWTASSMTENYSYPLYDIDHLIPTELKQQFIERSKQSDIKIFGDNWNNEMYIVDAYNFQISNGYYKVMDISGYRNLSKFNEFKYFSNVTQLPSNCFDNSPLQTIEFPNNLSSIGDYCFNLSKLRGRVSIPSSVSELGSGIFNSCSGITDAVIEEGVNYIPYGMFQNCTSLTSVTIPNSVVNVETYVFSDCTKLKDVYIPDSVKNIGNNSFYKCSSLERVHIPSGVTILPYHIFGFCSKLSDVETSGITEIKNYAFRNCSAITHLNLSNVESIGDGAFFQSGIKELIIPKCKSIGYGLASENYTQPSTPSLKKMYAPELITFSENAFRRCNGVNYIFAPKTETIGRCAFQNVYAQYFLFPNLKSTSEYTYLGIAQHEPYEFWLIGGSGIKTNFSYFYSNEVEIVFLLKTPQRVGFNTATDNFTIYVPDDAYDAYKAHSIYSACTKLYKNSEYVSDITYSVDNDKNELTVVMSPVTYNASTTNMDINEYTVSLTDNGNILELKDDFHYKLVYNIKGNGNVTFNINGNYSYSPSKTLNISL